MEKTNNAKEDEEMPAFTTFVLVIIALPTKTVQK